MSTSDDYFDCDECGRSLRPITPTQRRAARRKTLAAQERRALEAVRRRKDSAFATQSKIMRRAYETTSAVNAVYERNVIEQFIRPQTRVRGS